MLHARQGAPAAPTQFDVLHFHIDQFHFPLFRDIAVRRPSRRCTAAWTCPTCSRSTRLSGDAAGLDLDAQRAPVPDASTGSARSTTACRATSSRRASSRAAAISPSSAASRRRSAPDRAIEIARARRPAAQDRRQGRPGRRGYFRAEIEPLLDASPASTSSARSTSARKSAFLGDARALLFPIDWPEPFGLVMIEAMACGTPVLAFSRGSVPEVIDRRRHRLSWSTA